MRQEYMQCSEQAAKRQAKRVSSVVSSGSYVNVTSPKGSVFSLQQQLHLPSQTL